jgi:hypothetical protein
MTELEIINLLIGKAPDWLLMSVVGAMVIKNLKKSNDIEKSVGEAGYLKKVVEWHGDRIKILEIDMTHRKREVDSCHVRVDAIEGKREDRKG